jgi:hypothetical protein
MMQIQCANCFQLLFYRFKASKYCRACYYRLIRESEFLDFYKPLNTGDNNETVCRGGL